VVERRRPAVEEQGLEQGRVEDRGRVALAELLLDSLRRRALIGEAPGNVVAGRARHRAVGRQPGIEVHLLAQFDPLRGHGVILGDERGPDHGIQAGRCMVDIHLGHELGEFLELVLHRGLAEGSPWDGRTLLGLNDGPAQERCA